MKFRVLTPSGRTVYYPGDTTYVVLFKGEGLHKSLTFNETFRSLFVKIVILRFGSHVKGP
jgi:hypothetical protein